MVSPFRRLSVFLPWFYSYISTHVYSLLQSEPFLLFVRRTLIILMRGSRLWLQMTLLFHTSWMIFILPNIFSWVNLKIHLEMAIPTLRSVQWWFRNELILLLNMKSSWALILSNMINLCSKRGTISKGCPCEPSLYISTEIRSCWDDSFMSASKRICVIWCLEEFGSRMYAEWNTFTTWLEYHRSFYLLLFWPNIWWAKRYDQIDDTWKHYHWVWQD